MTSVKAPNQKHIANRNKQKVKQSIYRKKMADLGFKSLYLSITERAFLALPKLKLHHKLPNYHAVASYCVAAQCSKSPTLQTRTMAMPLGLRHYPFWLTCSAHELLINQCSYDNNSCALSAYIEAELMLIEG